MSIKQKGVILNIASDLGLIAPDQRLYKKPGLTEQEQPSKPITYSVIKHGLIDISDPKILQHIGQKKESVLIQCRPEVFTQIKIQSLLVVYLN